MTEKKKNGSGGKTRREFLKDAGLLVGGTAIGSTVLLAACGGGETTTVTQTAAATTITDTVTTTAAATTVTDTVTSTTTVGAGQTATVTDTVTVTVPGEGQVEGLVNLKVNGKNQWIEIEPEWPLSFVLREKLGLIGTKVGCDRGECGSCTIHVDGRPVLACSMLAIESEDMDIVTIEGMADGPNLHPVQQLFLDNNTFQCGYCTPGMIMSAAILLAKNPNPTRAEASEAISGNLCPCVDYTRILDTIVKGV